jgi:hypothetical protein
MAFLETIWPDASSTWTSAAASPVKASTPDQIPVHIGNQLWDQLRSEFDPPTIFISNTVSSFGSNTSKSTLQLCANTYLADSPYHRILSAAGAVQFFLGCTANSHFLHLLRAV